MEGGSIVWGMIGRLKRLRMGIGEVFRRVRALRFPDSIRGMEACDVVMCCADSDRMDHVDGLAYSRFADGLSEELAKCGVVVRSFALPYATRVGPASWANAYSANRFFFVTAVSDRLWRMLGLTSRLERCAVDFYSTMLARVGAKSIVGIGLPQWAIKAAKRQGVRSVEILHGYGYTPLPWGWDVAPAECLPDMVLAFDDVSAATFGQLRGKGIEVHTIENYWYRKFLNDDEFQRLPAAWRDATWLPQGKKIVLVSLSWGYDGDRDGFACTLKNGLFPEELVDAIRLAGDEYHWLFRLHPVQVAGTRFPFYKRTLDALCVRFGNCEWAMSTSAPLPVVLKYCHAHVSMISMTAYDAALMGVRSLMLCPTLQPGEAYELMFKDLEAQGFVTRGKFDAVAMHEWLMAAPMASKVSPVKIDMELSILSERLRQ